MEALIRLTDGRIVATGGLWSEVPADCSIEQVPEDAQPGLHLIEGVLVDRKAAARTQRMRERALAQARDAFGAVRKRLTSEAEAKGATHQLQGEIAANAIAGDEAAQAALAAMALERNISWNDLANEIVAARDAWAGQSLALQSLEDVTFSAIRTAGTIAEIDASILAYRDVLSRQFI